MQRFTRSAAALLLKQGATVVQTPLATPHAALAIPSSAAACAASTALRGAAVVTSRGFAAPPPDTLKRWKPTSNGQRFRVTVSRDNLWKGQPFKGLVKGTSKRGGRNNTGKITVWHQGGGHRKVLRDVDFKRPDTDAPGTVERLEYDPNRSARIALVKYPPAEEGGKERHAYIIAPQKMGPGDEVASGPSAPVEVGNTLPLWAIPTGIQIHNIEMRPGQGAKMCRAAGVSATLMKNDDGGWATVRLPSAEVRMVPSSCKATIGAVSNPLHKHRVIGKAGLVRWSGVRPTVRGVAMNCHDHPHGGATHGGRPSCSPWGLHTKGRVTRNNKLTDQFIVLSRRKAKAKMR